MSETDNHHTGPGTDTPLWQFSLAIWQQEPARELFLQLQEQGWSVTRLLCAGWLASQGMTYSGAEPQTVRQWRQSVTESIRSLKQSLSKSDSLLINLRESLARAELEAERIELYRAWQAMTANLHDGHSGHTGQIAELNLRQAAPTTNHSINEMTEPMIRQLAQLIDTTPAGDSGRPGERQA